MGSLRSHLSQPGHLWRHFWDPLVGACSACLRGSLDAPGAVPCSYTRAAVRAESQATRGQESCAPGAQAALDPSPCGAAAQWNGTQGGAVAPIEQGLALQRVHCVKPHKYVSALTGARRATLRKAARPEIDRPQDGKRPGMTA